MLKKQMFNQPIKMMMNADDDEDEMPTPVSASEDEDDDEGIRRTKERRRGKAMVPRRRDFDMRSHSAASATSDSGFTPPPIGTQKRWCDHCGFQDQETEDHNQEMEKQKMERFGKGGRNLPLDRAWLTCDSCGKTGHSFKWGASLEGVRRNPPPFWVALEPRCARVYNA